MSRGKNRRKDKGRRRREREISDEGERRKRKGGSLPAYQGWPRASLGWDEEEEKEVRWDACCSAASVWDSPRCLTLSLYNCTLGQQQWIKWDVPTLGDSRSGEAATRKVRKCPCWEKEWKKRRRNKRPKKDPPPPPLCVAKEGRFRLEREGEITAVSWVDSLGRKPGGG